MEEKNKAQDIWLRFFCFDARCLNDAEAEGLPEEKRNMGADPTI